VKTAGRLVILGLMILASAGVMAQNSSTFVDKRDGKSYRTVKIGNQTWMAENLNYNANGSKYYNNDPANGDIYGRFYNWTTAKKACPAGWHLPSDAEWTQLVYYVGGEEKAGEKLKSKSGWANNGNGTDEHGFSALPCGGGFPFDGTAFDGAGYGGSWWNSTEYDASDAFARFMSYNGGYVASDNIGKTFLFSVRCVQDR